MYCIRHDDNDAQWSKDMDIAAAMLIEADIEIEYVTEREAPKAAE
jgi:hypothetical protein